jgi:hypothetical protein
VTLTQLLSANTSQAADLVNQLTPLQWAILGLLVLFLVLAIVKKLAKTAFVLAILVGLGVLAFYGSSEGWFT